MNNIDNERLKMQIDMLEERLDNISGIVQHLCGDSRIEIALNRDYKLEQVENLK